MDIVSDIEPGDLVKINNYDITGYVLQISITQSSMVYLVEWYDGSDFKERYFNPDQLTKE